MSRGRKKISFEGLFQENVLGTFKIIRGFADLRDLAEVSTLLHYQASKTGDPTGYQRECDEQHIEDIKRFLKDGSYRFFPEIVLSLRSKGASDPIVSYFKKRSGRWVNDRTYKVSVNLNELHLSNDLGLYRICRIDGNHRLEAAMRLVREQPRSAAFKHFTTAPFCFVVLDSDRPEDDELAEAMLFNLINSKALPITSEQSLSVLMRDDSAPNLRFRQDPELYLTRWISEKIKSWPKGFYAAMGATPLSRIRSAANVLLRPRGISKTTAEEMEEDSDKIFEAISELAILLRADHEKFVLSSAFIPIAAEIYVHHSDGTAGEANAEQEKIRRAARWLREFGRWFERVGAADLPLPADPIVLWTVFKSDFDKKAGQVFICMSFREGEALDGVLAAIEEAIKKFNEAHPSSPLSPIRIDKYQGASYDIPSRVFHEIDQSRLVIADLTDEKQNVYCEVGYAKAKGIPFFLTFQKAKAQSSGDGSNKVHFDLAPQRYIEYETTHHLRDRLLEELSAWHKNA